jgi:hypothetical protein
MVVISPRGITAEETHRLISNYVNSYIWCHICRRDAVGYISYRIDFDLKSRRGRVVCAYCDPTVDGLHFGIFRQPGEGAEPTLI